MAKASIFTTKFCPNSAVNTHTQNVTSNENSFIYDKLTLKKKSQNWYHYWCQRYWSYVHMGWDWSGSNVDLDHIDQIRDTTQCEACTRSEGSEWSCNKASEEKVTESGHKTLAMSWAEICVRESVVDWPCHVTSVSQVRGAPRFWDLGVSKQMPLLKYHPRKAQNTRVKFKA